MYSLYNEWLHDIRLSFQRVAKLHVEYDCVLLTVN